ncbi:MAG: hypothetical protein IJ950_05485 [Helicobacter sp.]|nr:hypothetical protein [Helicobacter sp.]
MPIDERARNPHFFDKECNQIIYDMIFTMPYNDPKLAIYHRILLDVFT